MLIIERMIKIIKPSFQIPNNFSMFMCFHYIDRISAPNHVVLDGGFVMV